MLPCPLGVNKFCCLGITYDAHDLANIVQQNCHRKIIEIDNLLNSWNRRNISLLGRIQVIKSLALSKIVHFLIALPTPHKDYMRSIDKRFYRFIWRGKPPKIKESVLELDYDKGGLKMVNIFKYELKFEDQVGDTEDPEIRQLDYHSL